MRWGQPTKLVPLFVLAVASVRVWSTPKQSPSPYPLYIGIAK